VGTRLNRRAPHARSLAVNPEIEFSIKAVFRDIELTRRSVQSQAVFSFFPLDESGSPSAVNNTFLNWLARAKY
jgi:hypothetical protein